jgi:phospholipid/cholesterol/gamma-HCH transport system substrate-binding protein
MVSPQAKVGFLILASIIAAGIVIVSLGDVSIKKGYEFYILFDDLADLPPRATVKISGVDIGRVADIDLYKGRARIKVWIGYKVKIFGNTQAEIKRMGLIGNTYLSLTRGTSDHPRIKGREVVEGTNPLSYEEVIDRLIRGVDQMARTFENLGKYEDLGANINQSFANLKELGAGLNFALGKKGKKNNISYAASRIDDSFKKALITFDVNVDKIGETADELKNLLVDLRKGKGPAGKLLSSEEYGKKVGKTIDSIYKASEDLKQAVNRFKGFDTAFGARVYYESKNDVFRTNAGFNILSSSDRFLKVRVENMDSLESGLDVSGDRRNAVTIKAGKEIGNFSVFGGAIRSSGGVGASWSPVRKVTLETNIFEFTRPRPWWNVFSKLKLAEFLSIGVAFENLLEKEGALRAGVEVDIK